MNNDSPCRFCTIETGRYPGCHSQCEKGKAWKEKRDAEKLHIENARRQYNEISAFISQQTMHRKKASR